MRIFYIRLNPIDYDPLDPNINYLDTMNNSTSFMLTDEGGALNMGTVYNERGPVKIYLAGDTSPTTAP